LQAGIPEEQLNLSSLDRVELLSALEEKFHVNYETAFANAKTIADVQRVLQEPAAPRTEYVYPAGRSGNSFAGSGLRSTTHWLARHTDSGHPHVRRPRESPRIAGANPDRSNHITRRADIGLILAALPARFGIA